MADIGYIALFLAFVVSVYAAAMYLIGARGRRPAYLHSARNALITSGALVSLAVGLLLYALLTHDFSLSYVAAYTSRATTWPYLISALWAGNAGSLLFWAWLLGIFSLVVLRSRSETTRSLLPHATPLIMLTVAFFLLILLAVSDPFGKLPFTPFDGNGLNPMLQNPGMLFHPPALLAGYVLLTIPFAFALAALIQKRTGSEWTVPARRWMLAAWLMLGAGNLIGAWWAYVELGWGGYWAWDPVENAGLMPWLLATAFLHSVIVQRRRGMFKNWVMLLVIFSFILSIFGTFLTRSGLLSSVHTFGESRMGPFFMLFMLISLAASLLLLNSRQKRLKSEAETEVLVSREGSFLLNNALLVSSTVVILLGTLFPAISEAFSGSKIEVGTSFFNTVNAPLFLMVILLAGVCTLLGWKGAANSGLLRNLALPGGLALAAGVVMFLLGVRLIGALIAYSLCIFVGVSIFYQWACGLRGRRRARQENYFTAFFRQINDNRPRYGAYLVHLGTVLLAVGVIGSSMFSTAKEAVLQPGETVSVRQYTVTYNGLNIRQTPDADIVSAEMSVYNSDRLIGSLTPEKYFHRVYEQPVSEVAIRSTPADDLYIIFDSADLGGTGLFKVLVNPLVLWIWVGGGVVVFGGLLAFLPRRERLSPGQTAEDE
ncbi:MAG: heme lyase CcmF/NrfE family subunit [Chloroflexi bacterium]|nr:heme lyase CcmF/NrfE family subunit [Chloroflexota bacterium]